MAKSSFSIVPDSLINVGTGFGILLGLAVGLMSGLMIAPEKVTTTTVTASDAQPSSTDRIDATIRTLLIQRASLVANVLRLQAAGQSADTPSALLNRNTTTIAAAAAALSTPAAGNQFAKALDAQVLAARNLVLLTVQENTTSLPEAQRALQATNDALANSLTTVSHGTAPQAAPVSQKVTTAIINLATTAKQPQSYQAESNLVASFDELVSFLRNYRR